MSHVGYIKTTYAWLDLPCGCCIHCYCTFCFIFSAPFELMQSLFRSLQKTLNTTFDHIYVLHFPLFTLYVIYPSLLSLQLPSMGMALYSSRQQSLLTITCSAFASEPPAPMVCCFLPQARLTTCYWNSMLVACRWVHLWLQHMGICVVAWAHKGIYVQAYNTHRSLCMTTCTQMKKHVTHWPP